MIRAQLVGAGQVPTDPLSEQLARLAGRNPIGAIAAHSGATATEQLRDVAAELDTCADIGAGLAVLDRATVLPDEALLQVLDDPGPAVAALVCRPAGAHAVATNGASVLSAGTASHPIDGADADSLGVLFISSEATVAAADAIRIALAAATSEWDDDDPHDLLLTVLARAGAVGVPAVAAVALGPLPGARTLDPAARSALAEAIGSADIPTLIARHAARPGDGWYSTFVLRRISARLTPGAVRRGITANRVTIGSALVGLLGAALFAVGGRAALAAGALLLQLSLVLDCVDGEIARATRTRSAIGGWLDAATDRVKEYAALAGLAFAAGHLGQHVWLLAAAGLVVQTARHLVDFAFAKEVLAAHRAGARDSRPMSDRSRWQRPPDSGAAEALSLSMWVRRTLHFPIAERWLALSVCALLGAPTVGLAVYLAISVISLCWTVLGGIRRTPAAADGYTESVMARLVDFRDDGLLGLVVGARCPRGVAGWLLPAAVTLVEGAVALGCIAAVRPTWAGAGFGLLGIVIWHRYDLVYRRAAGRALPWPIGLLGLGWLIRTFAVALGTVLGVLSPVLVVSTGWLLAVYLPESLRKAGSLLDRPAA